MPMFIEVNNEDETKRLGQLMGKAVTGGVIIELVGDVGAGKTTLVKGIASGLNIEENVQSPSFTINRVYKGRDEISLSHYDFYRLNDAGIMSNELAESLADSKTVTVIEWGEVVENVLPLDRLTVNIISTSENARQITLIAGGENSGALVERIEK